MKVGKYQIGRFHAIIRKEYADGSEIEAFKKQFAIWIKR